LENVEKRCLIQVAAYNMELVIRHHFEAGAPRQAIEVIWFVFPAPGMGRFAIKVALRIGVQGSPPDAGDATSLGALVFAFST
jgi:hypothetical protein